MPIYKYTLTKYVKAYSTWVIVAISMLLVIVLGGYVPFRVAKVDTPTNYAVISVAIVAAITSFLSIFTSVFAGFKSSAMFKDEVEDGTFLVMLSKPISRSKIIFFKWLALQTAIIAYTFIVAISFLFAVSVFDTGHKISGELAAMGLKTLRSKIIIVSLMLWFILFIVSLIFSSIALLLSTKLSVGTTIGISIAIGVIIPITSLVGTFTSKPAYKSIANNNPLLLETMLESQINQQSSAIDSSVKDASLHQLINAMKQSVLKSHSLTDNEGTLYGLGLATNEHDSFRFAQAFDFNYQIQKLSEFASEQAIPEAVRGTLDFSQNGQSLKTVTKVAQENNPFSGEFTLQMETLNKLILSSWRTTQPYRQMVAELFLNGLKAAKINSPITVPAFFVNAKFTDVSIIKDDATKLKFISDAYVDGHLMTWINKSVDSLADQNEEIKYKQANMGIYHIMKTLNQNISLVSFDNEDLSRYFSDLIGHTREIFSPLGFWASSYSLQNFLKQFNIGIHTFVYSESETATHPDSDITNSLGKLRETLRGDDAVIYNELASAVEQGYSVAKIKTVEYTSKFTILWIYLGLALALVPLTYLVIRKQDFR